MNIIKGMDRIALVLAIIAILPGFLCGHFLVRENLKTLTPEYREYQKTQDKLKEEGQYTDDDMLFLGTRGGIRDKGLREKINEIKKKREQMTTYQYPPGWQCILGGLLFASLSFFVVLYGLRGTTRGTRWIIEGFRDKKAKEPDERGKQ